MLKNTDNQSVYNNIIINFALQNITRYAAFLLRKLHHLGNSECFLATESDGTALFCINYIF